MTTNNDPCFPNFPMVSWTVEEQERAQDEGWLIMEPFSDIGLEIDKDNDSDNFETAEHALAHVLQRASEGSTFHGRALAVHARFAIFVFKAANGYDPIEPMPEGSEGVSTSPRCSDSLMGYSIGNCAGCDRFPVVLYHNPGANRWRCEACYRKENGSQPNNLVSR